MALVALSRGANYGPALSGGSKGLLLTTGVNLLIFGLIFLLGWIASRASWDDLLCRWRGGILPVPLGIGYSVALRIAVGVAVAIVSTFLLVTRLVTMEQLRDFYTANRPEVETLVDISAMRNNPLYFWLLLTLVSFVLGGLREELWRSAVLAGMRKLWPRWFGSRLGQILAAALAAVLFGLGHAPMGMLAVGITGVIGFGLGIIMVMHRSIWPAVIAHGMFDATSMALIPMAMEKLQHLQQTLGH